jgi:hypothetical protein
MVAGAGVLYSVGVVGLSRRIATFKERDVIAALNEVAQHIAERLVAEMKAFEVA